MGRKAYWGALVVVDLICCGGCVDNTRITLPREVDLDKCISLGTNFKDALLELNQLPRLAEACVKIQGHVLANLSFTTDLNSMRMIQGTVCADVVLVCQRCEQEYVEHLEVPIALTPDLERARACQFEDKYEFIDFNEYGKLDLYEILEDSLLLEIPSVPKHHDDDEACERPGSEWSYGKVEQDSTTNPFAALSSLKEALAAKDKEQGK